MAVFTTFRVESTPDLIIRNGVSVRYRKFSFSTLYSYTADSFADALNTVEPPKTTGVVGLMPSYGIIDLNASFSFTKNLELILNINNLTDQQYFTKRPAFYPGPCVWPSEGRNYSGSFIIRSLSRPGNF
jgi:Fe(3+) dicitrate transport protein